MAGVTTGAGSSDLFNRFMICKKICTTIFKFNRLLKITHSFIGLNMIFSVLINFKGNKNGVCFNPLLILSFRKYCVIYRHIGTTQFQPTGARQAFPCFDEPDFKATFKLSMIHDKSYIALSNMPIQTTEDYGNNLIIDKFQESVRMSTYLVAFIVCDYKWKRKPTKSGVNVGIN